MKIIKLDTNPDAIDIACSVLKKKELIAFPTDSVYALCGLYHKEIAYKMHEAKKRPIKKPFILAISEKYPLSLLVDNQLNKKQQEFTNKYWPGKTSIILKKLRELEYPTGDNIAIRKPCKKDNPYFHQLLKQLKSPLLVPSLNLSGESPIEDTKIIKAKFKNHITHIFVDPHYQTSSVSDIWDISETVFQKIR